QTLVLFSYQHWGFVSRRLFQRSMTMGNYPKRRTFIPREERPPPQFVRKLRPASHIFRAGASHVRSIVERKDPEDVARALFAEDQPRSLVPRASSTQATTTTTGWAAEIAQHAVRDMVASITSVSAAAELITRGLQLDLGHFASMTIPGRTLNAANAGTWIAEGNPITVRAMTTTAGATLLPRKVATISVFTHEMGASSLIEDIAQQTMGEAAGLALDVALFGRKADNGAIPQGILNGVSPLPPTAGGGIGAMAGDIKQLFAALATNGAGKGAIIIAAINQFASLKLLAGAQ